MLKTDFWSLGFSVPLTRLDVSGWTDGSLVVKNVCGPCLLFRDQQIRENSRSRLQQAGNTSDRVNESSFKLKQLRQNIQSGSWEVLEEEELQDHRPVKP